MKRFFLNAALALALVGTAVACKGDKKMKQKLVKLKLKLLLLKLLLNTK